MFHIIAVFIALAVIVYLNRTATKKGGRANIIGSAVVVVGALLAVFPFLDAFGIIPAGDTGVVLNLGHASGTKADGLFFVTPGVQTVHIMDTKTHKIELNDVDAVTSDRQEAHTSVSLLVQVDPATADQTYSQYRDNVVDQVVMPKFQEAVKTITAQHDAAAQIHQRGLVQADMLAYVQHELQGKGVIIGPGALSITNFQYNPDYQKAIEDTAVAQQNLVKAEAELKVNKIEAEQKVATARGTAEVQALLSKQVNDKTLGYQFLEKWDGHLPSVMGGNGGNLLDVSKMVHG